MMNILRAMIVSLILCAAPSMAKDYGQRGAVFPIAETDLLRSIEQKLKTLESNGGIERMNAELARRTEAKVRRPEPVFGVGLAVKRRSWIYDPTITVEHDIMDTKGNIIARKGQKVNPLSFVSVRQALVFIDGDDRAQIEWAIAKYKDSNSKLIFVKGAPLDAMTKYQRRVYFDQGGYLTDRFGIRAVPAVVEQSGEVMRVSEFPVAVGRQ
jgi:conjugal transfer pilus assembly protein TraW